MKRWRTQFAVTGRGSFPIDMLRYEGCFPHSSADAATIEASFRPGPEERIVSLVKYHDTRDVHLEAARWGSFGWIVNGGKATSKL